MSPEPWLRGQTVKCGRFKKARNTCGEMAEWLKAHAWKACIPQGIQGSNPCLSAISFKSKNARNQLARLRTKLPLHLLHLRQVLGDLLLCLEPIRSHFGVQANRLPVLIETSSLPIRGSGNPSTDQRRRRSRSL